MRVFLPPPTGRRVVLPHVLVMGFDEAGRVAYEHIYLGSSVASGAGWMIRHCFRSQVPNRPTSARQHTACKRDDRTVAIESEAAVASFCPADIPPALLISREADTAKCSAYRPSLDNQGATTT